MDELKKRLLRELQQDFDVRIVDSLVWSVPVHSIAISFQTEKRTKMDVLMKMMLIILRKVKLATLKELSDILLVEPLFVEGILTKMMRTQMVEKRDASFALTDRGRKRLEEEVFIHEPEEDSRTLSYSPCHHVFLKGNETNLVDETKAVYRYAEAFNDWAVEWLEEDEIIKALRASGVEQAGENVQMVVSEIQTVTDGGTSWLPCLEFRLYNKAEDVVYARVWNTLTNQWDKMLETQLNEKERKKWREAYVKE